VVGNVGCGQGGQAGVVTGHGFPPRGGSMVTVPCGIFTPGRRELWVGGERRKLVGRRGWGGGRSQGCRAVGAVSHQEGPVASVGTEGGGRAIWEILLFGRASIPPRVK